MTLIGLLRSLMRVWLVVLVGAATTVWVADQVARTPGVYWAQVDVVLLRPSNRFVPNGLTDTSQSLIATAGVIQRQVTGGPDGAHVVSPGVTIVQEGVKSGEAIRIPNAGGQWANNFNRAVLDVQVVDSTPGLARARVDSVLARIDGALAMRQEVARVNEANVIHTKLSPATVSIVHDAGSPLRAVAVTLVLGMSLTIGIALLLESFMLRQWPGMRRGFLLVLQANNPTSLASPTCPRLAETAPNLKDKDVT